MRKIIWGSLFLGQRILATLLFPFLNLFPWLSKRNKFEQNLSLGIDNSRQQGRSLAFEVASEGEFEQITPFLDYCFKHEIAVELIYCSPSLDWRMQELQKESKGEGKRLHIYRMPLLRRGFIIGSNGPIKFLNSLKFIFCRYDFFPELLYFTATKNRKAFLVQARPSKKLAQIPVIRFFLAAFYNQFELISCTQKSDAATLLKLGYPEAQLSIFSPQNWRIQKRQIEFLDYCKANHNEKNILQTWLSESNRKKIFIFGNLYLDDFNEVYQIKKLLKYLVENKFKILIFPHILDHQTILDLKQKLISLNLPTLVNIHDSWTKISTISSSTSECNSDGLDIEIIAFKGKLCEFYALTPFCYVGGGFHNQVHSLLEPFIGGVKIFCGPKIQNSPDFDYINEEKPENIKVINDFSTVIVGLENQEVQQANLINDFTATTELKSKIENQVEQFMNKVLKN